MRIETTVSIRVTITVDTDARHCAVDCTYRRASRCGLYRKDLVDGRRAAECVRDTPVLECPDLPEFAHVREPIFFNLQQLTDIIAQPKIEDSAIRAVLAAKWQCEDKIPVRRSFAMSDTNVYGYGPTDNQDFFYYPVRSRLPA
jgi:hypothetical protein